MAGALGVAMKRFIVRSFLVFVALAIIGQVVGLILRRYLGHDADPEADEFDIINIMGGSELQSRAGALRSGSAVTVMGGTEIDLRRAELAPGGASLQVSSYASGTQILVSPERRVEVIGIAQAGDNAVDVTDADDLPLDSPLLVIEARTVASGLDVRAKAWTDEDEANAAEDETTEASPADAPAPEAVESFD